MQTALSILHIATSLFMILVILLQAGKSGGMGGLSGGGSGTVFGGRGSQTFLEKLTTACAAVFMVTSLSLAYISSRSESMILQRAKETTEKTVPAAGATDATKPADQAAPAAAPTPAAPAGEAAPAPAGSAPAEQK